MTRWSPFDLCGRLLDAEGDKWRHIVMPAINDKGEALHEQRYPVTQLRNIESLMGEAHFKALYQQEPYALAPQVLEQAVFGTVAEPPTGRGFWTLDLAISETTSRDNTVFANWIIHKDRLVLRRCERLKTGTPGEMLDLLASQSNDLFIVPRDGFDKGLVQATKAFARGLTQILPANGPRNKPERAHHIMHAAQAKKIAFCQDIDPAFERELRLYPNARNDDCVDVTSHALWYAQQRHGFMMAPRKPIPMRKDRR